MPALLVGFTAATGSFNRTPGQLPGNGPTELSGFVINGDTAGGSSGYSVSSAGDINGDNYDDLIIGGPNGPGPRMGHSYVVFGRESGYETSLDLEDLNGSNGFVVNSFSRTISGFSVSSAGDINGDNYDDLIIGAPWYTQQGSAFVLFGQDDESRKANDGYNHDGDDDRGDSFHVSTLPGTLGADGFQVSGQPPGQARAGEQVSSAGDVNGDGIADLIIGAPRDSSNGQSGVGATYVVFGSRDDDHDGYLALNQTPSPLDGNKGFVITGATVGAESGHSISSAGDINSDNIADIIIGTQYDNGRSYVVFGKSNDERLSDKDYDADQDGVFGDLNLASIADGDGSNGFVITPEPGAANSAVSVSSIGDFNADGRDDIIIGTPDFDMGDEGVTGIAYVVYGRDDGGFDSSLNLGNLNGRNGFKIFGIDDGDLTGYSVSSAGDINNDGAADIIIGASGADPEGRDIAGETYVLFGQDGGYNSFDLASLRPENGGNGVKGFIINGAKAGDSSGFSVSSAGDINGDGFDDIVIGAQGADPENSDGELLNAGQTYVIFGMQTHLFNPVIELEDLLGLS